MRSCISIAEWLLGSLSTSCKKLLEGRLLSMEWLSENRGDFFHLAFQVFLRWVRCSCRVAGILEGREVFRRKRGSRLVALDDPSAALLARESAFSLGAKSRWPRVQ